MSRTRYVIYTPASKAAHSKRMKDAWARKKEKKS